MKIYLATLALPRGEQKSRRVKPNVCHNCHSQSARSLKTDSENERNGEEIAYIEGARNILGILRLFCEFNEGVEAGKDEIEEEETGDE